MIRKILAIMIAVTMLAAIVPLSSAASDEIQAYNGWVGADSPLYGLKLFFQKFDESMTGDVNAKLVKQMAHAEERLSEACAMVQNDNAGAMDAALNEYELELDQVNASLDDPAVDEGTCRDVSQQLEKHQNHFRYMINNSTLTEQSRNRWANAFSHSEQLKNGRPFVYDNGTAYFAPPGLMKKTNRPEVPQGLAKRGFQAPFNGNNIFPVDNEYDYDYNYNYSQLYGNGTGMEPNSYDYNNSYDYQSPGPHGSGNGNGKK
jgi:hypothetical protein